MVPFSWVISRNTTFKLEPDRGEGAVYATIWGKSLSDKRDVLPKVPKMGTSFTRQNRRKASVSGTWPVRQPWEGVTLRVGQGGAL